jgi:hypothetical protein
MIDTRCSESNFCFFLVMTACGTKLYGVPEGTTLISTAIKTPSVTNQYHIDHNLLWRINRLLGKDFRNKQREESRCYATARQTLLYNNRVTVGNCVFYSLRERAL